MTPAPVWSTILADLAYVAALGAFLALQRLAIQLRHDEERRWWASNGRDVANGLAVLSLSGAVWLQGVAAHLALLLGATLTLSLSILRTLLHHRARHPDRVIVVIAAILGAPLMAVPQVLARGAAALLDALF
jgi:hypothetical protein